MYEAFNNIRPLLCVAGWKFADCQTVEEFWHELSESDVYNMETKLNRKVTPESKRASAKRLINSLGYDREHSDKDQWTSATSWTWDYSRAMINCYWNASMFSLLEDIKKFIRIVDKQWILEIGAHSLIESTQRVYGVRLFFVSARTNKRHHHHHGSTSDEAS